MLYYYLLIVKAMYLQPNAQAIETFCAAGYIRAALLLCPLGVVALGLAGEYPLFTLFSFSFSQ